MMDIDVRHYQTRSGRDPFQVWLDGLQDTRARVQLLRRLDRLEGGHLGDHRYCRDGVWELRVSLGPGYRVYFGRRGQGLILLLAGGDKSSQATDIARAVGYWNDYEERSR